MRKTILNVVMIFLVSLLLLMGISFTFLIIQDLRFDENNHREPPAEDIVDDP